MIKLNAIQFIENVTRNIPTDWVNLTTHRLDIYNETLAKTEFIQQFEELFNDNSYQTSTLNQLPTAYDYIRLGHPLSSVLEWTIAKVNNVKSEAVISFSSQTIPVLAILRKNLFKEKRTLITYTAEFPRFDAEAIRDLYGYSFDLKKVSSPDEIDSFNGSVVHVSDQNKVSEFDLNSHVDFYVSLHGNLGSILLVNGEENDEYIPEIQHVRRRETIAMTPANCVSALKLLLGQHPNGDIAERKQNKEQVQDTIQNITGTSSKALVASSGLSIQYAIMMGLIDHAHQNHPNKDIRIAIPPNCYGGTNDQARRMAACIDHVEVVDLPVDGENDMVQSIDTVLDQTAREGAIPYIIAEIPTNPRVEVPDLQKLEEVLIRERKTSGGATAIAPVFILDQTFCPNVQFLAKGGTFSSIQSISYVSGSKFPSGGKCTAGYCVANKDAEVFLSLIEKHLQICDNEATDLQIQILAEQLPSMNQRIHDAYLNTREFVSFIEDTLPTAKINFVSEELAKAGFTPSVFSLDLPTKGATAEEREIHKRSLNDQLIKMMITQIPNDSKYCVSYGQLKGCYWTIPATSTQGTTKESDKDYIARVALSPNMDLERHKEVFKTFVDQL